MGWDFTMSQGDLLQGVADIQMRRGVCFAMSTEWCLCSAKNRNFDLSSVFYQMVSRQRAYALTWGSKVKGITGGAHYDQFFRVAEPPSFGFMRDQAKHEGVQCNKTIIKPAKISKQLAKAIGPGRTCVLGFFGVRSNANWGHATAVGQRAITRGKPRFFDPNAGQYSWDEGTDPKAISQAIIGFINGTYKLGTIRNFVIYELA